MKPRVSSMYPVLVALLLLLALTCMSVPGVNSAVASDEIVSLPGWSGPLPSKHYSGYFPTTIDGRAAGMLHYWLTLSERSPATDPLVLWLQGGPGCSSLFGLLYENGQLHFSGDVDNSTAIPTLVRNPSAWTKVASVLWLEQPVHVGFSYCVPGAKGDCSGSDFGLDAYRFLLNLFAAYPELTKLPFHITGESYAGVYVPYIADAILTGNQQGKNPSINLAGLAIGNGVGGDVDGDEYSRRVLDFWYGHAEVSYSAMTAVWLECGATGPVSDACQDLIYKGLRHLGPFYVYNIYDTCPHDQAAITVGNRSVEQLGVLGAPLFAPIARSDPLRDLGFVCVLESLSSDYLSTKAVQAAIHTAVANVTTWRPCGRNDNADHHAPSAHLRSLEKRGLMRPSDTVGDLYKKLIPELPILIYSGDVDWCVPYIYSDNWLRRLGWNATSEWLPWMYGSKMQQQLGGYVTRFNTEDLVFLTVLDAGHMVPQYAPEAALAMFSRYLDGPPFQ